MWNITINNRLRCAAAIMILAPATATAQTAASYPNKLVRLILPYAAGGPATTMTRTFGDKLSKDLGQTFIIESRPGGNTVIGTETVARSAPDGHTLLVTTAAIVVNHWLQPNLPYDTLKDIVGVSTLIRNDHMIAVHPSVPASNLKEMISFLKRNPGKVNAYASGLGTNNHLENLLFMQATGTKYTLIPYKGGGAAIADLLSGQLQMAINTAGLFGQHIKAGKLKGIAISGDKRNPIVPNVPTFAEGGLKGFVAGTWYMLLAPAATPRDIIEKLNAAIGKAQASKDTQDSLAKQGIDPYPNSVAATNALLRADLESVGKVIKENNIKAADE